MISFQLRLREHHQRRGKETIKELDGVCKVLSSGSSHHNHELPVTVLVSRRSSQYQTCQKSHSTWSRWFVVPTLYWVPIVNRQLLRECLSLFLEDMTTGRLPWPSDGPTLISIWATTIGISYQINKKWISPRDLLFRTYGYLKIQSRYNHVFTAFIYKIIKNKENF